MSVLTGNDHIFRPTWPTIIQEFGGYQSGSINALRLVKWNTHTRGHDLITAVSRQVLLVKRSNPRVTHVPQTPARTTPQELASLRLTA